MNVARASQVQHPIQVALAFENADDTIIFRLRLVRALIFERESKLSATQRKCKSESNNKLDNCSMRAYAEVDDQVHAEAVCFGSGKAMAEGVAHLE